MSDNLAFFIGVKPSPTNAVKQCKASIGSGINNLDCKARIERAKLQAQQKKIREAADRGDKQAALQEAQTYIRSKSMIANTEKSKANMSGLNMKLTELQNNITLTNTIAATNRAMRELPRAISGKSFERTIDDFTTKSRNMEHMNDLINDKISNALDVNSSVEEDPESFIEQVFEELNIDFHGMLGTTPEEHTRRKQAAEREAEELIARLEALNKEN